MKEPAHDVGRRGAADGHADGPPDRQEPGCHPGPFGWGWATPVTSMIEGDVEVGEIDARCRRRRGDRFVAHIGFDPRALAMPCRWLRISLRRI